MLATSIVSLHHQHVDIKQLSRTSNTTHKKKLTSHADHTIQSGTCPSPEYLVPQVILCSACSGHGYKFCSVIGEILADLAVKGFTEHAIGSHRISANRAGHTDFIKQCQTEAQQTQEQRLRDMHAPISRL